MAGPSIVVRVLGDLKGLTGSLKDTGKQAESTSSRIRDTFSSTLGLLNRSGVLGPFGEALSSIDDQLDSLAQKGAGVGKVMAGLGVAAAGAGLGFAALGSKDKAAQQQLQAAIEATGKSYDDYADRVEQAIKHEEKFGQTASSTQDALRILTSATGSPDKALQLLNTTTDLAAAKHISLSEAATKLGKVYNGNSRLLKEFGITVTNTGNLTKGVTTATNQAQAADKALASAKQHLADIEAIDAGKKHLTTAEAIRLRDAQQRVVDATATAEAAHKKLADAQAAAAQATAGHVSAVDQLAQKLHGQAAASADTFTGHLKAITATVEDQAAKFGQKYGPALTAAGSAMTIFGGAVDVVKGHFEKLAKAREAEEKAQKDLQAANKVTTETMEAQKVATLETEGSMLPMIATIGLIVLAVAALVAIGYVIYRNWSTIWAAIKDAIKAVWDWIKNNWPLLLPILFGPIGLAALLIIKYRDQIWDAFKAVFNWIKNNWPLLLAILTGPIGLAVLAIAKNWQTIKDGAKAAVDWIIGVWNTVVDFFEGLPGKMYNVGKSIFTSFANAFVDAINAIINIWNGLQFKVPGVSVFGHHFGGFTIGVPDIPNVPHLASGGLITSDGLVYAHAGEAITPMPSRLGPAVAIENANFSSEVDVELFMRRAAWVIQTQNI